MESILARQLLGGKAQRQFLDFLNAKLPRLIAPEKKATWNRTAQRLRRRWLELYMQGHPEGLLAEQPRVEWGETIHTGQGYCIHKLRYEGYPGLWVPALLYEPEGHQGPLPVVLNPNGHHAGGKAMDYKQARCINLAKRGILALNTEFIGMGELRADVEHNRLALLDLCGVAGVGVFYFLMKRGLDVLLNHPQADPTRVAMTGLSGGGWQTIVLSALDTRINVAVPVAGHSPLWQRRNCIADIGDLEQVPNDFCTVADYDALTALLAPRPTLLIYNHEDDCCFQTRRTRRSIYQPVKPVFSLLKAADKLAFYDNVNPGNHNYEADNRSQLYQFLNIHFGLDTPAVDLPYHDELRSEAELNIGLGEENATLYSLAQEALSASRQARAKEMEQTPLSQRRRLAKLLRIPQYKQLKTRRKSQRRLKAYSQRQYVLDLDNNWSVPVNEWVPARPKGIELIIGDGGRKESAALVRQGLERGCRVVAADLFGTGENTFSWQYHMLLAGTGERPLGVQVGQLLVLLEWLTKRTPKALVHIQAKGQVMPIVGLIAAALQPQAISSLTTAMLVDSLERLVQWPLAYAQAPSLFCFGLLSNCDIPQLIELAKPVVLYDENRGPLRR